MAKTPEARSARKNVKNFKVLLDEGRDRVHDLALVAWGQMPGGLGLRTPVESVASRPASASADGTLDPDPMAGLRAMRKCVVGGLTKLELQLVMGASEYRLDLCREASAIRASFVANSAEERRKLKEWLPMLSLGFDRRGLVVKVTTEVRLQRDENGSQIGWGVEGSASELDVG